VQKWSGDLDFFVKGGVLASMPEFYELFVQKHLVIFIFDVEGVY
jgi:hypothetical protein